MAKYGTIEQVCKAYINGVEMSTPNGSLFTAYSHSNKQWELFSYGYHFPLAWKLNGVQFVDRRSYSNSTSKHQRYIMHALGYINFISLDIPNIKDIFNRPNALKAGLVAEIEGLQLTHDALKRKGTIKANRILSDIEGHKTALKAIIESGEK